MRDITERDPDSLTDAHVSRRGEAALAFASELMNAEDFQDLLAKQSRYAQAQMHNYDLQTQQLGRLMVGTA